MAKRRRKKSDPIEALMGLLVLATIYIGLKWTKSIGATIAMIIVVFAIVLAIAIYRKMLYEERLKKSGIADIDKMDGRQFEHYLGHLFRAQGYKVEVTRAAGDFGADLVLTKANHKIAVQAKRYSKNVGIDAVQEVVASIKQYGAAEGWVISNRDYTEAARTLAQSNGVRLIGRNELIEMILTLNPATKPSAKQVMEELPQEDKICPRCGSPMIRRKGPKGEFYGCSGFPKCRAVASV